MCIRDSTQTEQATSRPDSDIWSIDILNTMLAKRHDGRCPLPSRDFKITGLLKRATRKLLKTKNGVRRARSARSRPALQPALQAGRLRALRARRTPFFGFEESASHETLTKDLATP